MNKIIILGLLFLWSCEEKKPENIKLSNLMEDSGQTELRDTVESKPLNYFDSLSTQTKIIWDTLGLKNNFLSRTDTTFFIDRFRFKNSEKATFDEAGIFLHFQYKDSIDSKNAFFNWMDCFGPKCRSSLVFEKKNWQAAPFVLLVTERNIYYWENADLKLNEELIDNLTQVLKKERILYSLDQTTRGKVRWWYRLDEQWIVKE